MKLNGSLAFLLFKSGMAYSLCTLYLIYLNIMTIKTSPVSFTVPLLPKTNLLNFEKVI